ncbi:putative cache sensor protein [Solidesulfovibrio fructosivorans JJ]]|uniref:Putative cache sensor protein n=1 Tax=Solidesulfovibrio fructosivorans JJ] TaxID=596151 RepID=E1K0Q3_SOLFR|nr:cache domain-containing protein [Solidesulfovibrio fructosivorans]EFL49817.1 putative cache sensor protein [Solidesulfovibrio fructosivorans JJ]]
MKRLSLILLCLVGLSLVAAPLWAQNRGTKKEAEAMVKKAVAAIKADGREKAFAAIDDPKGPFRDRDLYVVVYDLQGKCLAHGANSKQIGKDLIGLRDPDGKFFVKERVELAKTHDSFWQDYKFINPMTKLIEPKSMYMEKVGDILVGCGIYKP